MRLTARLHNSLSPSTLNAMLHPEIEPYDHGMLAVGDGNLVYWEVCGNPAGKPAVVLHGGPGSGCTPWHRRLFDTSAYRVVLFDQRNCGRSLPHASEPGTDLSSNTTDTLVPDIELLRQHLGIDRWLVLGGSWGSTLALTYAEAYPHRVTELVLFGVTTGRRQEFDWVFREGLGILLPAEWERRREALPPSERPNDVVDAYHRLLSHPDPKVRRRAAEAWCQWESAIAGWPPTEQLAERFKDERYALAFARIVTHYVRHNAWLEDDVLVRNAGVLTGIPGVLIVGRLDLGGAIGNAWELRRAWPGVELVVIEGVGHAASAPATTRAIVEALERFAHPG